MTRSKYETQSDWKAWIYVLKGITRKPEQSCDICNKIRWLNTRSGGGGQDATGECERVEKLMEGLRTARGGLSPVNVIGKKVGQRSFAGAKTKGETHWSYRKIGDREAMSNSFEDERASQHLFEAG